jgi:hypothetical protein
VLVAGVSIYTGFLVFLRPIGFFLIFLASLSMSSWSSWFHPLRWRSVRAYDVFFFPAVRIYCPALNIHCYWGFHLSCPLVGGGLDWEGWGFGLPARFERVGWKGELGGLF